MNLQCNTTSEIKIPSRNVILDGLLYLPQKALGLILFVHGSGSSRFSVRNQYVANLLNTANLGTLLFDLLTPEEDELDEETREFRFDIDMLASRLIDVTYWCQQQNSLNELPIGYFGASTGAAAALIAAATIGNVKAVVSRGGRPDLAGHSLEKVKTPSLLIVGGEDTAVIKMNEDALSEMHCEKKLIIVPGATHLFEEPGTLDIAANLAKDWFLKYLK